MAVTVIGITAGVIVMAFIIFGLIALAQKRGLFHKAGKWSETILWSLLCKALGSCVVVAVQMNVSCVGCLFMHFSFVCGHAHLIVLMR